MNKPLTPKQIAKNKRDDKIRKEFAEIIGPAAQREKGSWALIDALAKKHDVTINTIYRILKNKQDG